MIGETLGVYHVHSSLGAGGMGEVYRARDTRLGRDVAIKVLPTIFTTDAERCARFEREARVLASINHPHIGAIYGIEGPDATTGVRALILELVEGETLAERIARKPLKLAEALDFARQIADALDAAHEKGIVHRDLKPANVKIAPDGTVKVLDFGIAKAIDDRAFGAVGSAAVTELVSQALVIIGTAAYMSPEQARGARVDKRTDIWAFGCVLFEMLAGKPAFARDTVTDTLARVLDHEPDWSLLPPDAPPGVLDLLHRCLEKDPRRRLRDIGDARLDGLAAPAASDMNRGAPASVRARLAWLFGGVLIAAVGFAAWSFRPAPEAAPAPPPTLRRLTDLIGVEESPAVSPDGKTVAFVARVGGFRQIWLRLLTGGSPLQITRDPIDHEEPRWSPDSGSIVYFTRPPATGSTGTIWEISAFGGERRRLAAATASGDVSRDGRLLAALRVNDDHIELATLTRDGARTVRSQALPSSGVYSAVRWSPDGQWLAFQRLDETFDQQLLVVPAAGGEPAVVARSSRLRGYAWLVDSSGLVYGSAAGSTILYPPTTNLHVVRRDGTGDRPLTFGEMSYSQPDVLASGAIVATRTRTQSDLWRFPVDGTPLDNARNGVRITQQTGQAQTVSVSPDGQEVAYLSDSGGHGNIWIAKTDGSGSRQITFEQDPAVSIGVPVWSETGNDIAVIVTRNGQTGLSLVRSDGTALREIVPNGIGAKWSPDDSWLYYSSIYDGQQCIYKTPVAGGSAERIRCGDSWAPAVANDDSTLYYVVFPSNVLDAEIRKASPANGPSTLLAQVSLSRIPDHPRQLVPTLSKDGSMLAMPLLDGATTNLWALPTAGGPLRPVTDFGDRAVVITRRVAWSPDGRSIYAAVADVDSDIVLLDGLLR